MLGKEKVQEGLKQLGKEKVHEGLKSPGEREGAED